MKNIARILPFRVLSEVRFLRYFYPYFRVKIAFICRIGGKIVVQVPTKPNNCHFYHTRLIRQDDGSKMIVGRVELTNMVPFY